MSEATGTAPVPERGFAFWLMVVSTVNFVAAVVFALGSIAGNLIVYLVVHGRDLPGGVPGGPSVKSAAYWLGHMPWSPPWWMFAVSAAIMVVVAVLARDPRNVWSSAVTRRNLMWRTGPVLLAVYALVLTFVQSGAAVAYDLSRTMISLYHVGPALCLVAAGISYTAFSRTRVGKPSTPEARELGVMSGINIIAFWILGVLGIAGNQAIYLALHGGRAPEGYEGRSAADLWYGLMPITPPGLVLSIGGVVMLTIVVLARSPERRNTPATIMFWFRTTPLALAAHAFVISSAMLSVAPYYVEDAQGFYAVAPWWLAVAVALGIARQSPRGPRGARRPSRARSAAPKRGAIRG